MLHLFMLLIVIFSMCFVIIYIVQVNQGVKKVRMFSKSKSANLFLNIIDYSELA